VTDTPELVIGFIGTGVMGRSMASHLLDAGHMLHVYNRTKPKAADLLDRGATWQQTPAAIAGKCNVIFTIVGFPQDVEEVYFGDDGILGAMQQGTIVVDMTTSQPDLAVRIAEEAHRRGGLALDAPVSGGDTGAREGTLSIMIGGDREAYERVLPLMEHMGGNIVYQGGPGSGQHCKMCNQIAIASNMMGVCEAVAYARQAGLDPQTVLKSISAGAAGSWSLSNLAPRILKGNFDPGFYVKHFIKDMVIASQSADGMGLPTPGLDLAKNLYQQLAANGHDDEGTQALYRFYDGEK
jgi:3-hydroxyisobutyrate dehydrogenase